MLWHILARDITHLMMRKKRFRISSWSKWTILIIFFHHQIDQNSREFYQFGKIPFDNFTEGNVFNYCLREFFRFRKIPFANFTEKTHLICFFFL
jgi:hypothetical protein